MVSYSAKLGTFLASAFAVWGSPIPPENVEGMLAISRHFAEHTPGEAFWLGVPAGFYLAAIVWMMPSARGASVLVIVMFTYLIAMGGFTHVIAGSAEMFLLLLSGEVGVGNVASLLGATLMGNVLGGTGLFALLAYGQVAQEIKR